MGAPIQPIWVKLLRKIDLPQDQLLDLLTGKSPDLKVRHWIWTGFSEGKTRQVQERRRPPRVRRGKRLQPTMLFNGVATRVPLLTRAALFGPLPEPTRIDPWCEVELCVNPFHWFYTMPEPASGPAVAEIKTMLQGYLEGIPNMDLEMAHEILAGYDKKLVATAFKALIR